MGGYLLFQEKVHTPLTEGNQKFQRGWGVNMATSFHTNSVKNSENSRGGGGQISTPFHCGGMDTFWNHTLRRIYEKFVPNGGDQSRPVPHFDPTLGMANGKHKSCRDSRKNINNILTVFKNPRLRDICLKVPIFQDSAKIY